MYYEWAAFHSGSIACVVKGGRLYPVQAGEILEMNGDKVQKGKPYKVNGYFEFNTMKASIPGKDGALHEEEFRENQFAVLLNNIEQTPTLHGIDF